jgi:hypothetical protein
VRAALRILALLALAAPAAGCGRDRLSAPNLERPAASRALKPLTLPQAGLGLRVPSAWYFEPGNDPLVTAGGSGTAVVAVWRYRRAERLPRSRADLRTARKELERAVKARDQSFELESARIIRVDGAPAIQLVGRQTVGGQPRRVRSTHAYAEGAEIVIDAYAAETDFAKVDDEVLRPLVRSLTIDPPQA